MLISSLGAGRKWLRTFPKKCQNWKFSILLTTGRIERLMIYLLTHRSKLFLNATITHKWLHILDLYSALMTFDQGQGESLYRAALRNFSKHDPLWKLYQLCHSSVFCVYVTSLNLTETILLRNEKKILLLVCWLFLLDENKDYLETFNALFSPLHRFLKLKQKNKTF